MGFIAASRLMASIMQGVTLLLLARSLGVSSFGAFAATIATGALFSVVTGFGTSSLALRLLSMPEPARVATTISIMRVPSSLAAGVGVVFFSLATIPTVDHLLLLASAVYIIGDAFCESTEAILNGLQKHRSAQLGLIIRRSMVLFFVCISILFDLQMTVGILVGTILAIAISPLWLIGTFRKPANFCHTLRASIHFWQATVAGRLETLDVTISSIVTSAAGAGIYGAANRLTSPLNILTSSALTIYTPAMSRAKNFEERMDIFRRACLTMRWVSLALIFASPIIGMGVEWLLGSDYSGILPVVIIVTIGCAASAQSQPIIALFYSLSMASTVTIVRIVVVPFALVLMFILGSVFGVIGVAVASFALQFGLSVAFYVVFRKKRRNLLGDTLLLTPKVSAHSK